jgi:hypothetical protein
MPKTSLNQVDEEEEDPRRETPRGPISLPASVPVLLVNGELIEMIRVAHVPQSTSSNLGVLLIRARFRVIVAEKSGRSRAGKTLRSAIRSEFCNARQRKLQADPAKAQLLSASARRHLAGGEVLITRLQVAEAEAFSAAARHQYSEALRILRSVAAQARATGLSETAWDPNYSRLRSVATRLPKSAPSKSSVTLRQPARCASHNSNLAGKSAKAINS